MTVGSDQVEVGERMAIAFQRTLRIPDDGGSYPLPPGLGRFPVFDLGVDDAGVTEVLIPMYQREALWIAFRSASWKPNAVTVAVGGVNVISGETAGRGLAASSQDYVVCPPQLWLDGINTGPGQVRQFVAVALGQEDTVEAALTGQESSGGLQITVFEPKPGLFPDVAPPERPAATGGPMAFIAPAPGDSMGIAAGGIMRQKIYPDPHGVETWDGRASGRLVVHLVNSLRFEQITGRRPPPTPVDAALYAEHGLPWFEIYDADLGDVVAPEALRRVESLRDRAVSRGDEPLDEPVHVSEEQTTVIHRRRDRTPADGETKGADP